MTTQTPYSIDYAIKMLRQAIDFAESDGDFAPLRKWANEVELSARAIEDSADQRTEKQRDYDQR